MSPTKPDGLPKEETMNADKDRRGGMAGRPLFDQERAREMGLMEEPGKLAALHEGMAGLVGTVLGIVTIPGAVYLTFWRWHTAWPWVLIPAGSWLLVALLRRYVIGENLLLIAIPASMIYGVIGFVLLVGAIL